MELKTLKYTAHRSMTGKQEVAYWLNRLLNKIAPEFIAGAILSLYYRRHKELL